MLKNCQSWKSKIIKNLNWPNWRKMSNIVKSDQIDENCQKLSISCSGQLQDQWTAKKCQKYSKIVNNNNKNVNICWIWSISESPKHEQNFRQSSILLTTKEIIRCFSDQMSQGNRRPRSKAAQWVSVWSVRTARSVDS